MERIDYCRRRHNVRRSQLLGFFLIMTLLITPLGLPGASAQKGSDQSKSKTPKESQSKDSKSAPPKDGNSTGSAAPQSPTNPSQGNKVPPLGAKLGGDKSFARSLNVSAGLDDRSLDPTLRDLIRTGAPRRYFIYNFRKVRSGFELDFRAWNGLLAIRNLSDGARPRTFRLLDRRGRAIALGRRRLVSGWYKNPDGSIAKLLLNGRNQPVGNLSIDASGNKTLAIDLDGDGRAEFLAVHGAGWATSDCGRGSRRPSTVSRDP